MWFLNPKRTVRDVAEEIVNGLRDGSVILSATLKMDEDQVSVAPRSDDTPHPDHPVPRSAESTPEAAHTAS